MAGGFADATDIFSGGGMAPAVSSTARMRMVVSSSAIVPAFWACAWRARSETFIGLGHPSGSAIVPATPSRFMPTSRARLRPNELSSSCLDRVHRRVVLALTARRREGRAGLN
jgi:hypothetical protein